jgi:tetratricopeptide (TPR) repeat protein
MRRAAIGCLAAAALAIGAPAAAQTPPYPRSPPVDQAMRLEAAKDYAGALKLLDGVLTEHPDDLVARAVRGDAYLGLGDYARAMSDHDAVLAAAPHDQGALTNACWVRALANVELDRALTYCDASVKDAAAHHRAGAAYDTRGFLHYRRGEFALAVADYDVAGRVISRSADPLYGRGLAKLRLGKTADGQTDLSAALKLDASIAETFAKRGAAP